MTNLTELPPGSALETKSDDFLEVLRMLAHRLSQPLTSMRGSVEVALMGELDESESRRLLQLCLQESYRMAEVLETLRDILEMEDSGEGVQLVSWTQRVEKLLEEAASVDKDCRSRLVSNVKGEVWVKARPQHLDTATARLIGGAIRAARRNRVVRINLQVDAETACLSVCEEGPPGNREAVAEGPRPSFGPSTDVLGGLDQWVIRRAIERQGGWLNISEPSAKSSCYQLNLPLATTEIAGKVRP